jgi:hypothetical protein
LFHILSLFYQQQNWLSGCLFSVCGGGVLFRVEAQPAPALPANNDNTTSAARCAHKLCHLCFLSPYCPIILFAFSSSGSL